MSTFKIAERTIGGDQPCYIIAEISCNHEGDFNEARRIIEIAAAGGADAVKLQTYTADTISRNFKTRAKDTMWDNIDLHSLYSKAHTPWDWHSKLKIIADDHGVHLFSSPFDETAVDFLVEQDVPVLKVASFEVVDIKLLEKMAQTGLPIIMSNGMTDFLEMKEAIDTLYAHGTKELALLHCNSGYPASFDECNLDTIPVLERLFGCVTGLSDHTIFADDKNFKDPLPHIAPLEAVRRGAKILEVHLMTDRDKGRALHAKNEGGFDWAFSRNPDEFANMVKVIRAFEASGTYEYDTALEKECAARAAGQVRFEPTEKEIASRNVRPSLWVVEDIKKGEALTFAGGTDGNIDSIRPSGGLHIRYADTINGMHAAQDIEAGTPLGWDHVSITDNKNMEKAA